MAAPSSGSSTARPRWETDVTRLPAAREWPAAATGLDGRIYVFGGSDKNIPTIYDTTFIYNPATNSWASGAPMPTAREAAKAITLPDGRIAVMGGDTFTNKDGYMWCFNTPNCTIYNTVEIYDPTTDSWTTAAPMLTPRYRFASVLGADGRVYAIGGWDGSKALATVEAYNPDTNTWSYVQSLPRVEEDAGASVDLAGRIIVVGGFDGSYSSPRYDDSVFVYDGHGWTNGAPMPTAREGLGVTRGADGRIYAFGGFSSSNWTDVTEAYDPTKNTWSSSTPLPSPRSSMAAVTGRDGQIYALGGNGPIDQVAIYGPSVSFFPAVARPGAAVALTASNFTADATVNLYWDTALTGTVLATATADANGQIRVAVTIPVTATTGYHTITALDAQAAYPVTTQFVVCDCATPTAVSTATAIPVVPTVAVSPTTTFPVTATVTAITSMPIVTATVAPTATIGLAWDTSRTSLPRGRARPAVAVGRDGNIYAFGGLAFSHPNGVYTGAETATTYIYHPLTNTWTQGAPMPTAREGARAITLPDGRIAVLGGGAHCVGNSDLCDTGTVTNRVDVYDPGADAWSSLAPMRSPRYRFAAALYHGRIYAIGGSDGHSVLSSVESYDPATDSWSAAASLPRPEEGPVAVTDGTGRIDVIGGLVVSSTTYDTLFLFDGTAWSSGPHLLEPINDAGATLGPDGRVYAIGGFDATAYRYTARVQVYDPRKATWSEAAPLPVPVSNMGAVMAVGGQLYAIGAYDGDFVPGVEAQVAIYGPSIGVDSLSVAPGSTVSVSGTGFTPNGTVSLSLDSSGALGLIEATADVSGTISLPLTVPLTTTNGPHTVTALDVGASYPVTTSIVVRTGDTVTTPTGTAPPSGGTGPGSATASPAATKDVATIVVSATDTSTATTAPVSTPSPIPATSTSTPTVRPISSTTATGTPTPALTATATSTNTPVPPMVTSVPRVPTDTPAPVGATAPSETPTHTPFAATPTSTPIPPTGTPIPPTNIPATVTAGPTNASPSAGAPDPSNTPTTASTGGGAATGSRMLPATSVPTRPSTGHESGGVTIVFVDVPHGNVASGGTVGVRLRTTPHALVGITLRLTHTSYALVKHGAHRARVARTQVLFRSLTHPRADARGQAREGIRIAYATARALSATLTITAHLPSGSATQSQPVTIQPAHVHRQQTRPRP